MLSQNPQSYTWSPDIVTQIHLLKNKVDRLASLAFYDMQNDTDNEWVEFEIILILSMLLWAVSQLPSAITEDSVL